MLELAKGRTNIKNRYFSGRNRATFMNSLRFLSMWKERNNQIFEVNPDSAPTTCFFVIRGKNEKEEKRQREEKRKRGWKGRLEVCAKLMLPLWKERMNQSPFFTNVDFNI